jgi:hypothetical protein
MMVFLLDWRLDSKVIEIPATRRFSIRTMTQILLIMITIGIKTVKLVHFTKFIQLKTSSSIKQHMAFLQQLTGTGFQTDLEH